MTIADGMVYVGRASGHDSGYDASFIDPALPVAASSASAGQMGYWPAYRTITPECRRRYLEWLASGKGDTAADVGYVFIYFYGLERRLLVENAGTDEVPLLAAELCRLRTVYASNHSFDGYSHRLLDAVALLQSTRAEAASFAPDLTATRGSMPLALKAAIAREVVAGRPLGFELCAGALIGLHDFTSNHWQVLESGRAAFLQVLRPRFQAAFPGGFTVRNRKDSHLRLVYHGASAGMNIDLVSRAGHKELPDPESLTWTKLVAVADAVATELAPYAKTLAYHPMRANSLSALALCPSELKDSVALEARRWLQELPSPSAVAFGELAKHALGTTGVKWTIRHRRQVGVALTALGFSMEPDPEEAVERVEDSTTVQVFRGDGGGRSRSMEVACAAAMLVATVSKAFDSDAARIAEFWLSQVPSRLSVPSGGMTRLRARVAWLTGRNLSLVKVKRLLADAAPEEREFCAWSATVAAGASSDVGKLQIALLEAIHDVLGVPRAKLYVGLHAGIGAAAPSADEPVLVSDEAPEVVHAIPRPPTAAVARLADHDRLARIRAETERVSAMLAEVFVDDDAPLAQETVDVARNDPFVGLDAGHRALLKQLLPHAEWPRADFDAVASALGLMPDGAMETINEWAFDNHGDALLEDGDPVLVNLALLPVDPETAAAA
jgi:hypothetical protein